MKLKDLLEKKKISAYRLSKISQVPYSTISDLITETTDIFECSSLTLYKIARSLNVSMEYLLEGNEQDFELFKSEICQQVKRKKDINFIIDTLKSKIIFKYYRKEMYREAFYLLAMLDYLSRINKVPLCKDYCKLRKQRLSEIVYPRGILMYSEIMKNKNILKESVKKAIPEFLRFNIVEAEIRDVA